VSYVAAKGGEEAISAAHAWVSQEIAPITSETLLRVIREQRFALDRIMQEGSLYAPELAARAWIQSQGDSIEAIFLLRALRASLSRYGDALPIDTKQMQSARRISAAFKDLPGGQHLGDTYDYSHRLLGFFENKKNIPEPSSRDEGVDTLACHEGPMTLLAKEGLLESPERSSEGAAPDLGQSSLDFPANRPLRLQALARADEGFLLGLAYSTQRGYGHTHPFLGELRRGWLPVQIRVPGMDAPICIGEIPVTECQMIHQSSARDDSPQFTRGYGLVLGDQERKAMAMALVDRALRAAELGESISAPAQDQEFVLQHADNVAATGFVEHLKLPHHVDFQSELTLLRTLRASSGTQDVER